jgi:hypothetical protein
MPLSDRDLNALRAAGLIDDATAARIVEFFRSRDAERPRFDLSHTAYYLGSLVVMSAMGWFMNEAWSRYGGLVLSAIAVGYALVFIRTGETLWQRPGLRQPGGLLFTLAVWMTPLLVFGIQHEFGWWPQAPVGDYQSYYEEIRGSWVVMEGATIVAALAALKLRPFPFLTFPLAFALWFLSLDLASLLISPQWDFEARRTVTFLFGAVTLGVTYLLDRRTREDYAYWLYLFGLLAFWGALTTDAFGSLVYLLISVGLMLVAILLQRRTFMVFGSLGVFVYLGHLAFDVFRDSLLFPGALVVVGIAIIAAGVWLQKRQAEIDAALLRLVPEAVRASLPRFRTVRSGA